MKQYTKDEKRQLRQERGTWTDLSNRVWDRYDDTETDCIVNMSNLTTTNVDFHKATKHTRRLLEFASEVAFSSEDIPAHSIPVTIASPNTVYAPANLDIPDEPKRTPPQTSTSTLANFQNGNATSSKEIEVKSDYHQSLSQCLLPKTKLYMVQDGGHIPDTDHGSYGWVLASSDGILWAEVKHEVIQCNPTETQDTANKSPQASNGHPGLSGSNARPLTRSGSNDARNYTTKRTGF
jgi:hypothetical protein